MNSCKLRDIYAQAGHSSAKLGLAYLQSGTWRSWTDYKDTPHKVHYSNLGDIFQSLFKEWLHLVHQPHLSINSSHLLFTRLVPFGDLWPYQKNKNKTPPLIFRKIEGKKRRWQEKMRWFHSVIHSMNMNFATFWETMEDRRVWRAMVHVVA